MGLSSSYCSLVKAPFQSLVLNPSPMSNCQCNDFETKEAKFINAVENGKVQRMEGKLHLHAQDGLLIQ
jgi:hypothetical protein